MFEVHITTNALTEKQIKGFIAFCEKFNYKPIVIQLPVGETQQQPMISKVIYTEEAEVFHFELEQIKKTFFDHSYPIKRVKIEVPLNKIYLAEQTYPLYKGGYGEWHAKIQFEDEKDLDKLRNFRQLHLSRNSLKGETNKRIITYRQYDDLQFFQDRTTFFHQQIEAQGFTVIKAEHEYCIYDSNKSVDKGWIETPLITDSKYLDLLIFEGFIQRKSAYNDNFILKGSLVTRQFLAKSRQRNVNDLDFVYEIQTKDDPSDIFSSWVTQITETELDDPVSFRSFHENDFWRGIDYEMHDDFPTTNTDLLCRVGEMESTISLDISWNLPLNNEVISINYQTITGHSFPIRVVALPLQISWKLHQSIVRPRVKDLLDIIFLLQDNDLTSDMTERVIENLRIECKKDRIAPNRLNIYSSGQIRKYCEENEDKIQEDFLRRYNSKTPFGIDLGSDFRLQYITKTYPNCHYESFIDVLKDFEAALLKHDLVL